MTYYAIDFDSRSVESKSEEGEDLASYVLDNNLTLAIALVSSEDELCLEMSLGEMQDLYANLTLDDKEFDSEESAAKACWSALEEESETFPKFTPALGKKLLKQAAKRSSDATVNKGEGKAKKPSQAKQGAPKARIKLDMSATLTVIDGKCKSGSILHTIVKAIDEELCGSVQEVLDYIVANHVIPKTGELADIKFAEHNVKYFLKQGKISTGEEL